MPYFTHKKQFKLLPNKTGTLKKLCSAEYEELVAKRFLDLGLAFFSEEV